MQPKERTSEIQQTWEVEPALNEVADAIEEGASPLTVPTGVRDGFKARYRFDFEFLHRNGVDWNLSRPQILELAQAVGSLARALTIAEAVGNGTSVPDGSPVDEDNAYLAGYLVALISLELIDRTRTKAAARMAGHWCQHYYLRRPDEGELVDVERGKAALMSFLGHLPG